MLRRLVAIGDLHGDYSRLVRILKQHRILTKDGRTWDAESDNVDLVLLGDYIDWRGETLEGSPESWHGGAADVLAMLRSLHEQVAKLRANRPGFFSRILTCLGNHDKLMLDSFRYLRDQPKVARSIRGIIEDTPKVQRTLPKVTPQSPEAIDQQRLLRWLSQGGWSTVRAFGGFDPWMQYLVNFGQYDFLRKVLKVGYVLNGRLFSHSVPDDPKWWIPVHEIDKLPYTMQDDAIEAFIWGRRVWGFDTQTGQKTTPPTIAQVDEMLSRLKVRGVVMGHSLVQSHLPVEAYDGRIVNIDLHGIPGSQPYTEEYEVDTW